MSKLLSVSLIILGAIWLFYAYPMRIANVATSFSDASQLESDLKKWADRNATKEAVDEIYTNGGTFTLERDSTYRSFVGLTRDIVDRSSVPGWPGVLAVLIGVVSFIAPFRKKNREAEQSAS